MGLLPSRMQFADTGDFKPLGKPLRHYAEKLAAAMPAAAVRHQRNRFEYDNHGNADKGCAQEFVHTPQYVEFEAALKEILSPRTLMLTPYQRGLAASKQLGQDRKNEEMLAQLAALVDLRTGVPVAFRNVYPESVDIRRGIQIGNCFPDQAWTITKVPNED